MASSNSEVEKKFRFFRVYKDGRIELYHPHWKIIPPFDDPITGVRSKGVIISSDPSVSARIFLPRVTKPTKSLLSSSTSTVVGFAPCHHSRRNTMNFAALWRTKEMSLSCQSSTDSSLPDLYPLATMTPGLHSSGWRITQMGTDPTLG
ncbi:hypothetical protein SLE2022_261650 [Rubroshorea leprosula]